MDANLKRLLDAQDGIASSMAAVDPETLWLAVKYHLAPLADRLANDFRRFTSGAWTLAVYVTQSPGPWAEWHGENERWHAVWATRGKSRIAEFYLPAPSTDTALLALPHRPPEPFDLRDPDPDQIGRLIDRATEILRLGDHAAISSHEAKILTARRERTR